MQNNLQSARLATPYNTFFFVIFVIQVVQICPSASANVIVTAAPPLITPPPDITHAILLRSAGSATCGYISGNINSSLTCASPSSCYTSDWPHFGCCDAVTCALYSGCYPYGATCGEFCTPSEYLTCTDAANPSCITYELETSADGFATTSYACGTANATIRAVTTPTDGTVPSSSSPTSSDSSSTIAGMSIGEFVGIIAGGIAGLLLLGSAIKYLKTRLMSPTTSAEKPPEDYTNPLPPYDPGSGHSIHGWPGSPSPGTPGPILRGPGTPSPFPHPGSSGSLPPYPGLQMEPIPHPAPVTLNYGLTPTPKPNPEGFEFLDEYDVTERNAEANRHADTWLGMIRDHCVPLISQRSSQNYNPITIAILDTGVDMRSPVLSSQRHRFQGRSWIPGEEWYVDQAGHGTHIAGLVSGITPFAQIKIARICKDTKFSGGTDIVNIIREAIEWAVYTCGADIVSMSFGFQERHLPIRRAIEDASSHGTIFLAAASNAGGNGRVMFPANIDSVICVNAADGQGVPASINPSGASRNRLNRTKGFTTLGVAVPGPWINGEMSKRKTGTSFATPIAAAIAALVLEYARQTFDMNNEQEKAAINELHRAQGMRSIFSLMGEEIQDYEFVHPALNLLNARLEATNYIKPTIMERVRR